MTARRASHASPGVIQIGQITAFRELEPSRLGGRSLCIEGAAGERCDGGSVKAAYAWQVTIICHPEGTARAVFSDRRDSCCIRTNLHRERTGGGTQARLISPILWQRRDAIHGPLSSFRN